MAPCPGHASATHQLLLTHARPSPSFAKHHRLHTRHDLAHQPPMRAQSRPVANALACQCPVTLAYTATVPYSTQQLPRACMKLLQQTGTRPALCIRPMRRPHQSTSGHQARAPPARPPQLVSLLTSRSGCFPMRTVLVSSSYNGQLEPKDQPFPWLSTERTTPASRVSLAWLISP